MYGAKADGRRTYRFFEPEMDARVKARRTLELDTARRSPTALSSSTISPSLILEARDCRLRSSVALEPSVRSMISPAEFIPVAEETGLICNRRLVLDTACAEPRTGRRALNSRSTFRRVQFRSHAFS